MVRWVMVPVQDEASALEKELDAERHNFDQLRTCFQSSTAEHAAQVQQAQRSCCYLAQSAAHAGGLHAE